MKQVKENLELKLEIKSSALFYKGAKCTQYIAGSEIGDHAISVQGWEEQETEIKQVAQTIVEAVNNYNALKQSFGDLLTEISPAYNFDFSKAPDPIKKAYQLYNKL